MAEPPTWSSETSNDTMRRRSIQSMTRRTSRMTSGPMPSPGSMRSFLLADIAGVLRGSGCGGSRHPGLGLPAVGFIPVDAGAMLEGLADIVQAVQQQVLAERIDLEADFLAVRADDNLLLEVDGQAGIVTLPCVLDQLVAHRARQANRQNAVLEAVVVEDVGEVRRDDAADAEIQQCPGGVLAGRAAAEVFMRNQNLRLAVGSLVEDETRVFRPVLVVAQRVEQVHAQAGALDGL